MGPPDDVNVNEWRRVARQDWHRLQVLLADGDGEGAGFFLQQAVEKFLKGFLIRNGWRLKKIHTLHALVDDAARFDPTLAAFRPFCERVSNYYVVDRDPGLDAEGPDVTQVEQDLEEARRLILCLFPDEHLD
jgi:HEPN domain-containing protein